MTSTTSDVLSTTFQPLREQLLAAAKRFATDAQPLSELLAAMVEDVARADAEPLEIFPVCHHSPASALHLVQRISRQPPKVIFMEMCEDLRPLCEKFRDCKLPVAFQAFAGESDAFPKSWTPLSIVAPFTEFSAEYQTIAYCLENNDTDLVFVDRSVDHIFQWMPQEEDELEKHLGHDEPDEEQDVETLVEDESPGSVHHGAALGVEMGQIEPTFEHFREFLIKNAQVRHFSEWWDQYVEQAVVGRDYDTYRQVFFLVGSLLRRLGQKEEQVEEDRQRERYMWTRMKEYLKKNKIKPTDALYICGAIHAVSDIEEYGSGSKNTWDIPARTKTPWLYGMIPSSYAAIERQFGHPPGTVTMADASWQKSQKALGIKPFVVIKPDKKGKSKKTKSSPTQPKSQQSVPPAPPVPNGDSSLSLMDFLTRPPALASEDEEQLLAWCSGIVALARRNGYLCSTADSIAVYHTSVMLAQLRNRHHPSPYDFRDAAITCLEKDRVPKKRNIHRLCEILLGGDRIGQVGYDSLPPLTQDVYDRLAPLKLNLMATKIQRALLDLRQQPELLPCSDLLWKLRYLLQDRTFRPIMGERKLGHTPTQESWDIDLGKNQTGVIMLAHEGVTVEHVLEKRLKTKAFASNATPVSALEAVEDCIIYLKSVRLAEEMGEHSVGLLVQETGAQSAPEIFERVRRLVHYHRSTPTGLPDWLKQFVTSGYSHYCTLLPESFADRGTNPDQVAGMLAFLFTLESLALSLGCSRDQLIIAVKQAGPITDDPNKIGLLWAAEWLLGLRTRESIREFFDELLDNPMALPSYPSYLNGFLLALKFTPLVARLVVELVSQAFERLPDRVLMPWLPGLIMTLRPHADSLMPPLLKEASACFPEDLAALLGWVPPWNQPTTPTVTAAPSADVALSETEQSVAQLLRDYPASTTALAHLIGAEGDWAAVATSASKSEQPAGDESEMKVRELIESYPASLEALEKLL